MVEARLVIINPLGLHARAAARLVRTAGKFSSRINIKRACDKNPVDAKSILNVLTLAASVGTELHLTVKGDDEAEALETIRELFVSGFGEI